MRRPLFSVLALAALAFGLAVLLDVVQLETARQERWATIFAFAGVMFCVGVLSAGSDDDSETPASRDAELRPAAAEAGRVVPAAPGSLRTPSMPRVPVMSVPAAGATASVAETAEGFRGSVFDRASTDLAPVWREPDTEPESTVTVETEPESTEPVDTEPVDTVPVADHEGDDSVESLFGRPIDTVDLRDAAVESRAGDEIDDDERIARALAELATYSDDDLISTVKQSELDVIQTMMERGQLSSEGPITDADVAMMVFLSCTTEELLDDLRQRRQAPHEPSLEAPSAATERPAIADRSHR